MYLANHNLKVANLPLLPEIPVPKEIYDEVSKNINNSPEFSKLKNNNRNTLLNKEPLNKSIIQDIKTKFYLVGKASALKFIIPIILSGAVLVLY